MKIRGNGRAKILTSAELNRLFERELLTPRDKLLFAITCKRDRFASLSCKNG